MPKIKKTSEVDDAANGVHKTDEEIQQEHMEKISKEPPQDEAWLDELTESQEERDRLYRDAEKGDFTVPREDYTRNRMEELAAPKTYKPIDARELADKIVDVIFEYIKSESYSPNWPRVMSALAYAKPQVRRRWVELLPTTTSKFAKRYSELTKISREQKLKQIEVNEAAQPERRGGEAKNWQTPGRDPADLEGGTGPLVAPQIQQVQEGVAQPDDVLPPPQIEDREVRAPRMGDPPPGLSIPGKDSI